MGSEHDELEQLVGAVCDGKLTAEDWHPPYG